MQRPSPLTAAAPGALVPLLSGPVAHAQASFLDLGPGTAIGVSGDGTVVVAGTWCFQARFRDGHPTTTSNFNDAVCVTLR